jgi:hypothetical protein
MITRLTVALKIHDYLKHKIRLEELVDWSEKTLMDGEFSESDSDVISGDLCVMAVPYRKVRI